MQGYQQLGIQKCRTWQIYLRKVKSRLSHHEDTKFKEQPKQYNRLRWRLNQNRVQNFKRVPDAKGL